MKCIICGKEFVPRNRGGMPRKVCSEECKKIRIRELNKKNYEKRLEDKKAYSKFYQTKKRIEKQMPKSKAAQLTQLQREAQAAGMSYGQYVAMTERRKQDEQDRV